jgi:methyl-accepting chemotaxis protein
MNQDAARKQDHIDSANRFFLAVLAGLLLFSLSLAPWHGTWEAALLVGGLAALVPGAMILAAPQALATRMAVGAALMVFCGLNIHQGHGMVELHFGIFAMLALLLCYQDWRVILCAAAVIAAHHALFSYLQQAGYGVVCMPMPGFLMVAVHAAYVVVESAALCYLALALAANSASIAKSEAASEKQSASLRTLVAQAHDGVDAIDSASRNLANSSESIAGGAQRQAESLQQTSASIEQITATVRQSAQSAKEANRFAAASGDSAQAGGLVVSDAVAAMGEINASSTRISEIISTVDEIAFQTNLLAVNAAVEAARAGEQGRGFAVVAAEVRALAVRSAEAAKEIKALVHDSLRKVERGTQLVNQSGATFAEIVVSVKRVRTMVGDIATAAEEQSRGIDQVNAAMAQMDAVTQTNTAQTEDLARTAQSLSEQSGQLMQLVGALAEAS